MKIRNILQDEIHIFYELIGEIEYTLFSMKNEEHINWLKKRVDRLYYNWGRIFWCI